MTTITLGTCLSLTATQSYVLKVYGAISSSRAHSGSPLIWELSTVRTMRRTAYICSLHGLPVTTFTMVRGDQASTYGGERDTEEQGGRIVSAAKTELSFIFNSLGAVFSSCFIPASRLKKMTVVVEISTTKFARHDASVSARSL